MASALILCSVGMIFLSMLGIFYALWDILMGRWTEKKRRENEQKDNDLFDH